jgi:hypothetical protein
VAKKSIIVDKGSESRNLDLGVRLRIRNTKTVDGRRKSKLDRGTAKF